MEKFPCPLTEDDWQFMREACQRCSARREFIPVLESLNIETADMNTLNDAVEAFCKQCEKLKSEGKL